jgi:hypothetical protein
MELLIYFSPLFIIWSLFLIMCLVLPVVALIQLLKNDFKDSQIKLMWTLVVIFVPIFGAILYFSIGRKQRITPV